MCNSMHSPASYQEEQLDKRAKLDDDESTEFVIAMPDAKAATLHHLLLFLYTDVMPNFNEDSVVEVIELMEVAQGLFLPQLGIPNHPVCSMRRLYAMCEDHLHGALSPLNAGEILRGAMKVGAKTLEKGVYVRLAEMQPAKEMDFNRRLIRALGSDPELLARAISAAAGSNEALAGELPPDFGGEDMPMPQLLSDLRLLLQTTREVDGKAADISSRVDCRLIAAGQSELGAHRFMLAARSEYYSAMLSAPMEEAGNRQIRVALEPGPSVNSLKALLSYLYTGEVEESITPMNGFDWLDVLAMLDGHGGENYLLLSDDASSTLRHRASDGLSSSIRRLSDADCWMLLRKAVVRQNTVAQRSAIRRVVKTCAANVFLDAASFDRWRQMPDADWWTAEMEIDLLRQVLKLKMSCEKTSGKSYDQWDLVVKNPWRPDGQYGSRTSAGNCNLVLDESPNMVCGCWHEDLGSIEARFAQPVYVDHILVAPLQGWEKSCLKEAELQVMSDDGRWETLCASLSGEREAIPVFTAAAQWRLHGKHVAASLFKFMA